MTLVETAFSRGLVFRACPSADIACVLIETAMRRQRVRNGARRIDEP